MSTLQLTRPYFPLNDISQIAYVTNDFNHALKLFGERYGITKFYEMRNAQMQTTPNGMAEIDVALAWAGNMQIEIITPLGGDDAIYRDMLPTNDGYALRLHHLCRLMDTEFAFEQSLREVAQLGMKIASQGCVPGIIRYVYIDQLDTLGHYLEHTWYDIEGHNLFANVPRF